MLYIRSSFLSGLVLLFYGCCVVESRSGSWSDPLRIREARDLESTLRNPIRHDIVDANHIMAHYLGAQTHDRDVYHILESRRGLTRRANRDGPSSTGSQLSEPKFRFNHLENIGSIVPQTPHQIQEFLGRTTHRIYVWNEYPKTHHETVAHGKVTDEDLRKLQEAYNRVNNYIKSQGTYCKSFGRSEEADKLQKISLELDESYKRLHNVMKDSNERGKAMRAGVGTEVKSDEGKGPGKRGGRKNTGGGTGSKAGGKGSGLKRGFLGR